MATTLGVLIGLSWPLGAITCALWLVLAALFRYSSLAALLSILIGAVAAWYFVPVAAPVLACWRRWYGSRHHENIRRLLNGTEPKIGKKRYRSRVKPSALQSSLPTPWWTKNSPSGSTKSFTARSRG